MIRRDARLRIEFERKPQLEPHEAILKAEHEFNLYSLRSKKISPTINHELDYQFKNQCLGLPRWEAIVIDPPSAKARPKEPIDLNNPRLDVVVCLPARQNDESIFVRTERREIVHVPGSYNFYTPEFMKGLRLSVVGCPPGVRLEVWVRPHGGAEALVDENHTWSYDQLIFPGQGIEIKFISTTGDAMPGAEQPIAGTS